MTDSKKLKLQQLRKKLLNLSPEEKQKFIDRGLVVTIDGRVLSAKNTIMLYVQLMEAVPTVVGGFQQWKKAGRHVKEDEISLIIFAPLKKKIDKTTNTNLTDEEKEALYFYPINVFDVSQTEKIQEN